MIAFKSIYLNCSILIISDSQIKYINKYMGITISRLLGIAREKGIAYI